MNGSIRLLSTEDIFMKIPACRFMREKMRNSSPNSSMLPGSSTDAAVKTAL